MRPILKKQVNIRCEYDRAEWCKVFKCSERDLRRAVRKVGGNVIAVCLFLRK
jgi:hypothetical protein